MDYNIVILLFTLGLVGLINAHCPVPPLKYNHNTFMCAVVYEHSTKNADSSCNGKRRNIYNGEKMGWIGHGWNDQVSSITVRPLCKLTVYDHIHYKGRSKTFTSTDYRLKNKRWGCGWSTCSWNDRITSWKCECPYSNEALRCKPRQYYKVLKDCNNPSPGKMNCEYQLKKGLQVGRSVSKGKTISHSTEFSIGAVFEGIFSVGLTSSTTRSYNWQTTDSKMWSTETTSKAYCDVPPYHRIKLRQLIGQCGDTIVHTARYECAQ